MWLMAERRSPLALVVLSLLAEEPMHAYGMQQKIKSRHKDEVVNVAQRNSVYQTIERLLRAGYVRVAQTTREAGRPERTVYEITPEGREVHAGWLRTMLAAPAREFPEFPAALAFLALLDPADARDQLDRRAALLRAKLDRLGAHLAQAQEMELPRLFAVETEYDETMTRAELRFVEDLAADLRSGRLTWSAEWLAEVAARFEGATA
ncbi:MAG: PadR family transcriptional regulator [Hamadaea sp.]|nr:PadR family transcriptional regulator [Hamadaea sp.]